MENRLKLRISRMFRSSFGSCRSRNLTDVIEKPNLAPTENQKHYQLIELFSPKPRPLPSICRSKCSETFQNIEPNCIISKELFPRRKVSDKNSLLKCPPASPISTSLHISDEFKDFDSKPKVKKSTKITRKKTQLLKNRKGEKFHFGPLMVDNDKWLFSSEDDDETTLFSSKSLSSDTSDSFRRNKARCRSKNCRKRAPMKDTDMGLMPLQGRVRDSFPVVKRSSDPYNDFRTSMVEMILEKQIFSAKDLENLLQCFLSLNSYHHHRVIIEVFTEIWETLFSNWS